MLKRLLLILLLISTHNLLFSQTTIKLTSPVLRQIFQRNLSNEAIVTITGTYSQPIDTLQVRMSPVKSGQGIAIDWTVLKANPLGGLFKGSVTVKGGWYKMEVRGLLRGKVVGDVASIEKVGVGEVFVIAGQSNAGGSGLRSDAETAAGDDRVNCANFLKDYSENGYKKEFDPKNTSYVTYTTSNYSLIEFSQLSKNVTIGPLGLGPYYWGKVGDALAAKLNVPIMFFNTGWGGSSVRTWRESAENPTVPTLGDFQDVGMPLRYFPVGYPYENLNSVLRYYGINLGVRAVLWMEGETQNLVNLEAIAQGKPAPVTIDNYLDNLQRLIKKSRQDLGTNKLAWVVARTSYSSQRGCDSILSPPKPSPIIVNAQNQAITTDALRPIFPGPFTDNIQVDFIGERDRCVHFTGKGLTDVADAWIRALTVDNKNFFETVEPISADTIPSVSLECVSTDLVRLSLPAGYQQYRWVNETTFQEYNTRTVNVPAGSYVVKVTRANGNIVQVPSFTVKTNLPPKAPVIKAIDDVNFCIGTSVTIQSTTEAENPIYQWNAPISNIAATSNISVSNEGSYTLRVVDKNACQSPISNEVKLTVKPRPVAPTISFTSSTEFCDEQSVTLVSSNEGAVSYLWNTGETTQSIVVKNAGTFFVQTRGTNNCLSPTSKDNITTFVNPLPKPPTINALSDVVFCEGSSVNINLTSPDAKKYTFTWERNGVLTNNNPSLIKVSGTELVKGFVRDEKGCLSKASNVVQTTLKDNPTSVSIVQKGTYTLGVKTAKLPTEFVWKYEGKTLATAPKDTIIRAIDAGNYTVQARNIYQIQGYVNPLVCISEIATYGLVSYDDKGLSVYPNPSRNGRFTLESRYNLENTIIAIYTVDGRLIYQGKIDVLDAQKVLDLSTLVDGTYILRATNNNFKISKKILIER
ncbi:T9SS type A sorting domain-containing protein [Arcicella aquatica]|uniref:T9SS type A sorting domain-containing protein n=1 Tax=Arcicella aquatica TaxID=217141 RepID=A0ABU5QI33_9BACT|nr:T9SS type A sorting domain-containing protein [Arcicella aquatica]MEA5256710.1 T9SS type A sorting domain-containing protein [Arcicella aquatica]